MSLLFQSVAVAFGIACVGVMVTALVSGYRAVRVGGTRLLFNGIAWFTSHDRIPPEARPHMRQALRRFGWAVLCVVMAAAAGATSAALA